MRTKRVADRTVTIPLKKRNEGTLEFAPPGCCGVGDWRVVRNSGLACDRKNQSSQRCAQFTIETALGCPIKTKMTEVIGECHRRRSRRAQVGELGDC